MKARIEAAKVDAKIDKEWQAQLHKVETFMRN